MNVAELMRGLSTLAWVAALAVVAIAVLRAVRGQQFKAATGMIIGAVVAALLLTSVSAGLVFIQPEERGIVVSAIDPQGYRTEPLNPGLHWIVPFAESVVRYPISKTTYTMSIAAGEGEVAGDDSVAARTADGQEVFIDASVIYAVDPEEVLQVHIAWQKRYTDEFVRPLSRGIIRDEAAIYGVEEIYSERRSELAAGIQERLTERFDDNGLLLTEFVIRNITFTPEYAASVEQKQIAEQRAQQAGLTVEQRRQEAEQARQVAQGEADANVIAAEGRAEARLIEAEAEAEALRQLAAAIEENPDVLTLEYIQKIAPGIQVMLLPSDNPFLLPLPELQGSQAVPTPAPTPTEGSE